MKLRPITSHRRGDPYILVAHLVGVFLAILVAAGCALLDVRRAEQLVADGRWDEAVVAYREVAKEDPFNEDILAQLKHVKSRAAEEHYRAGKSALKALGIPQAVQEFQWAVGLDPSKREHHYGLGDALRLKAARRQLRTAEKLRSLGRLDDALASYERAVELDPALTEALEGVTTVTAQQRVAKSITKSPEPVTLRFQRAKLREVFEILARTAGVNVVFDKDVRDDPVTIFLKDMPYDDALKLILNTNNLRSHRVARNTLLVVPNTKQKQAHYQDLMIRTFYLSNAPAKKVVNLLRSMLESKRVYVDEDVNAVVVRDQPAKLHLAERVIHAIDRRQPEVELELEVLEVDRTKSMEYGVNFAKSAGVAVLPPGTPAGTIPLFGGSQLFTFSQLTENLDDNQYLFNLPSSLLLDFFKQESDAKTLASPKIRVVNKQKATINVGDKQPILLSTTNVLPAAAGVAQTTSTVTSIEFKDTGVKLTVEPTVHLEDEITLKIKVEVTRLGDEITLQDDPLIKQFRFGNRTAETTLRMRDDETVVLGGLIQEEDRKTRLTVPLLGDVPILGELLSSTTTNKIETEIVLTITPHIIRNLEAPTLEGQAVWSGTGDTFSTDRLFTPDPTKISFPSEDLPSADAPESEERADPSQLPEQAVPSTPGPPSTPQGPQEPGAGSQTPSQPSAESFLPVTPPVAAAQPPTQVSPPEALGPPDKPLAPVQPQAESSLPAKPPVAATQPSGQVLPPNVLGPPAPPGLSQPQPAPQTEPPKQIAGGVGVLAIRPSQLVTRVGQQFRVDLTADQVGNLSESVVTVTYNPQILEFLRASEGALLKGDATPSGATLVEEPKAGQVVLHARRQGARGPATGALAGLFFRAKAPGTSRLLLEPTTVSGPEGQAISIRARSGAVVVR